MLHNYIFITGLCGKRFVIVEHTPPPGVPGQPNWIPLIMMQIGAIVVDLIVAVASMR